MWGLNLVLSLMISVNHCLVFKVNAKSHVNVVWKGHSKTEHCWVNDDSPSSCTFNFTIEHKVFEFVLVQKRWDELNSFLWLFLIFKESGFNSFTWLIFISVDIISKIASCLLLSGSLIVMCLFKNFCCRSLLKLLNFFSSWCVISCFDSHWSNF